MRHVMSCIVLRFHKNKYQAACYFLTSHSGECYLRQSESLLWAGWGQDTPDFLADCWKEIAMISCHFRARKCSTIRPERSNPQSVSLLLPPWNKSLNRCHWKPRLAGKEGRQIAWQWVDWKHVNCRWTLDWLSYARQEMGWPTISGRAKWDQTGFLFPGFSRAACMFPKRICSISGSARIRTREHPQIRCINSGNEAW